MSLIVEFRIMRNVLKGLNFLIDVQYFFNLCIDAEQNYEIYKNAAVGRIDRKEYTINKRYDFEPFWFERNSQKRGSISKKESESYYGFDNRGRIIVSACDGMKDTHGYTEYDDSFILTRVYTNGKIDSIKEYKIEDDRPISCVEFIVRHGLIVEDSWYRFEEYIYENERLSCVHHPQFSGKRGYESRVNTYFEYDASGALYKVLDNQQGLLYINISKPEAVHLREVVKKGLIAETVSLFDRIRQQLSGERLCFVAIYLHGEPNGLYDPIYHPGLEKIRMEQLEQNKGLHTFWNSGEHPGNYQVSINNSELLENLRKLINYWGFKSNWWVQGKKFWHEVAYAINELDWSESIPITDDFIVYVDWEGLDVSKGGLLNSIPYHKLEILRQKGLLKKSKGIHV